MQKSARNAVAASVVALGIGIWAFARHDGAKVRPQAPIADPVADDREVLLGEVRRLGLENATLRAQQRSDVKAEPAPEKPPAERPSPEKEAEWLMARAAFLDDVLAKQARDEKWAAGLEARARTLAEAKASAGVKIVSATCRSTACRMEFTYADADARMKHVRQLGGEFEELPRISYAYPGEPESHTRAIMYLAQQDHPLPQLDYSKFAAAGSP